MSAPRPVATTAGQVPVRLFALATAVIVLSLYLAQPLVGLIGPSLGLSIAAVSLVSTLTLLGYALGLFVLVPLCDLLENRRLVLVTLGANTLSLLAAACPLPVPVFLAASMLTGFTAAAIQMLIPMAAAMTIEAQRGRVIGNIMSGLILGVLLPRPLASLIAGHYGWRASYAVLAVAVAVLTAALARALPRRQPPHASRYAALLRSMLGLLREEPVLRRHAVTSALCFAAFNAFWSLVVLRLTAAPFGLGPNGIALFTLAGVSGAVSAPLAGRLGDRGHGRRTAFVTHAILVLALVLAWFGGHATTATLSGLAALVFAAVLLDAGTIADQALGRRAINLLRPEARGRINGLFTGIFFLGGALGSAIAGLAWTHAGWSGVCFIALVFALLGAASGLRHPACETTPSNGLPLRRPPSPFIRPPDPAPETAPRCSRIC